VRTDARLRHHLRDDELAASRHELAAERRLRAAAETNATRFHALMLQARVRLARLEKETR
jgi:hypothetical protein